MDTITRKSITLNCLGTFEVVLDITPVRAFPTDKIRALLAYLALEPRSHRRELLAGLLWPEMSDTQALTNVRLSLHRLRQTLDRAAPGSGAAILVSTRHTVHLNPAVLTVDANLFQSLLAACTSHAHSDLHSCVACMERLIQAVELYRGELLAGFSLVGVPAFEEWLLLKREQLQHQVLTALAILTEHHLRAGRFTEASDAARRQIALNPWHEAAHRQLIRTLIEGGDRAAALMAFEHYRQALHDELHVEPDDETLALVAKIRAAEASPVTPPVLPTPLSPLVGREGELALLHKLLQASTTRLVTIVGIGGAGKTRLAQAAAWALADAFAGGVWWVPLAGVTTDDLPLQLDALAAAVSAVLGQPFGGRGVPLDELRDYLRNRAALLVFDNCEHLSLVPSFVRQLLEAAPRLRVLATSRTLLDMAGEIPLRLDGLPVPERGADDPASYAGVRLFVERAQGHIHDFDESPTTLASVARLCRLLNGLPLGIELAARWVGHYTCDEIASEIQANLNFLTIPKENIPERQRGLYAAFDYSWRLLAATERLTLARLSVFQGTFDRAAAQQVTGAQASSLALLVDASLVRNLSVGRYGFHELVWQFAAMRLAEFGEIELLHARHATYYLNVMAQQEATLYGNQPQTGAVVLRNATDNIRQAWAWAVDHSAWEQIADSLPALRQYVRIDGLFHEYASRIAATAERLAVQLAEGTVAPTQAVLLGRLRGTEAYFLERQEQPKAAAAVARTAIKIAEATGDTLGEAYGYLQLSIATVPYIATLAAHEMLPAISWLERAIDCCRSTQADTLQERRYASEVEADCLLKLSTIHIELREYRTACALAEQALVLVRGNSNGIQEAQALSFSAMALENAGQYEAAYERRMTMLALARANGIHQQEHIALNNLSCTLIYLGDYHAALEYAQAACRVVGEWMQNSYEIADTYHTLSWAACRAGDVVLALDTARQALSSAQAAGAPQYQTLPLLALGDALHGLGRYTEAYDAYSVALTLGQTQHMPPLLAVALAGIARCQLAQGALVAAQATVDTLLASQNILTLGSLWEPLRVAQTCYQVLAANSDSRATELVHAAVLLLEHQANAIANPTRRRIFREQVTAHRTLLARVAEERYGIRDQTSIG